MSQSNHQNMETEILFDPNSEPQDARLAQLKQLFPDCFDKNGVFLAEKMAQALRTSDIDTSKEYYTLNWLGKSYAKVLRDLPPETLLAENHEHNSKPEHKNSKNLLIKGDNLEVLKHLTNAYKGTVKMIYIDPPYNTGKDGFVYQDDRKFTAQQLAKLGGMDLDEAQRVLDFTAKKSNSHSAWLTFMYPRLYIARELLKDDGVIFISIDDNEQAQLKLLCDEVFGEENFVGDLIWSLGTGTQAGHFVRAHENILCYFKDKSNVENFSGGEGIIEDRAVKKISTKNPESEFLFPAGTRWDAEDGTELTGTWGGSEQMTLRQGKMIVKDKKLVHDVVISAGYAQKAQMQSWFSGQETFDSKGQKVLSFYFNKNGILRYEKERSIINPPTILKDFGSTKTGTDEVLNLFNAKVFNFPKPSSLIQFLLSITTNKNDLILDFFAGSGTTAHAVMQLNAEDGGNRQFIMVQLPETTDPKSEAHKAGYQTIFDITKARIEKAAAKIQADNPDYQGDLGFKIFETVEDFRTLPEFNSDSQQAALLFPDLSQLNDGQIQTLLTTWRVYDGQKFPENIQPIDLAGYNAYLCDKHLYLLHNDFASAHIKALLDKLDEDKTFVIERIVLLGDAIDSAKQQELNQAIKTYANKKSLKINVLVRY
ncbi:site-specific DNA-methyltransferase [Gallibacterium anatis]|uniref:site-specific DNA-methyltransferase n=1 Tax=Gallibacterium anatis TaxID=750 RepID=UPI0039FCD67C